MKTVLVTGGSGFLGSYTCRALYEIGLEAVRLDRLAPTDFLADVRDATAVSEAVGSCDGVIHLAGVLGTAETVDDPRPAVETNVLGSLNVFQACRRWCRPGVYIAVGNYWMHNPYSITKRAAEGLAFTFNREHGTRIAVVRGYNAYGPGQKAGPVRKIIPNFILPAITGKALTVYGGGMQVMDMIHARDVALVLVRALTADHGIYDRTFDAGTGRHTTVQEIAKLVIRLTGAGSISYVPMRRGEPAASVVVANPETLRPLFGDLPTFISLEEGLDETIAWYKENPCA